MYAWSRRLVSLLVVFSLFACSSTPQQFAEKRYSLSEANLCRTYKEAQEKGDYSFSRDVKTEIDRRNITPQQCESAMTKQSVGAALAVVGAALVVGAAARSRGGGGGAPSNQYAATTDYDWAWDQFHNQYYQLVWACRGRQTGQFAPNEKCAYKPQNDFTWPGYALQ